MWALRHAQYRMHLRLGVNWQSSTIPLHFFLLARFLQKDGNSEDCTPVTQKPTSHHNQFLCLIRSLLLRQRLFVASLLKRINETTQRLSRGLLPALPFQMSVEMCCQCARNLQYIQLEGTTFIGAADPLFEDNAAWMKKRLYMVRNGKWEFGVSTVSICSTNIKNWFRESTQIISCVLLNTET